MLSDSVMVSDSSLLVSSSLVLFLICQPCLRVATNLETWKVREFDSDQGKWKKSGKMCFACGVDDMSVMD